MDNFKKVALLVLLCNLVGCAVSQQPSLMSFADFMEFDIGLHKACENVAGGFNTTWKIVNAFTECTFRVNPSEPKDNFESWENICKNRGKYFECWDQMKADAMKTCGKDKEGQLPAVYRASVQSLCGNDNGAKIIENLKSAVSEINEEDEKKCPEQTGIHWIENCKDLLPLFNSGDLCARHGALDKCLQKITCDNIKFALNLRQVYTDARPFLQCNERKA